MDFEPDVSVWSQAGGAYGDYHLACTVSGISFSCIEDGGEFSFEGAFATDIRSGEAIFSDAAGLSDDAVTCDIRDGPQG